MSKPLRVLMVEDSEDDALLIIRELKKGGYDPVYERVETALSMHTVLREKAWDIILCDYQLPQFNGPAAIAVLKETGIDIPLIIVSGAVGEETAADCMRYGARDFIVKGNLSRLVPSIERELEEAESRLQRKVAEKALIESEERFRRVSSVISDIAYSCNTEEDGLYSINWMTGAAERISGYSIEEIKAQRCWRFLVVEEDMSLFEENVVNLAPGSHGSCELRIRHKNGGIVWVASSAECVMVSERPERLILYGGLVDITERKKTEEALRESEVQYRTLVDNINFGINLIDKDFKIITTNVVSGKQFNKPAGELAGKYCFNEFEKRQAVCQHCPAVKAMATGQPHQVDTEGVRDDGSRFSARIHSFPLFHPDGATKGFVEVVEDITVRKQAEEELQRTLERLRKAVGITIQVMVSAVETRDPYTAGHQIRSADLARSIAVEMGLITDRIDGIRMMASIHDIGKLSIPAEILSKPSKLSDVEFRLIKEHSRIGYEILKNVDSPWPLAEVVYQHHERMDGSGYPRNLKGDDILMEARIMAVADVVESMASHRPYRPSLGVDAALDEIAKNRDTLYDPDVVDACLKLFHEKGYRLQV